MAESTSKARAVPKHEAALDEHLAQVGEKIRVSDLTRGLLALTCVLLGYALVAALVDLALGGRDGGFSLAVRLTLFVGALALLGRLAYLAVWRWKTNVNPLFAARELERSVPDAKNSLVNWLDLKGEELSPAIRNSVSLRAARDIERADADLTTSSRDYWRLGGAATAFAVGLLILLAIMPRQFGSLMARAFVPLRGAELSATTTITIVRPVGGDATVPTGSRVEFVTSIQGRVPPINRPDSPALLYRHAVEDKFVRVALEEDVRGQWTTRLAPDQLRAGLEYKIVAGDASTPLHTLVVRSQPFVTKFDATYTYRPYRKLPPETVTFPNAESHAPHLIGHRGTQVTLTTQASVAVKSGAIEVETAGKRRLVVGEPVASEPKSLVFRFPLERTGTFRVLFETLEGEKNLDRAAYAVDVIDDREPYVEILKPGKDVEVPQNASLLAAGLAVDDFGVAGVTFKLKLRDGKVERPLADVAYLPAKPLAFADGTYPTSVQFSAVFSLGELRLADGAFAKPAVGAEIVYWAEAVDAFDYPKPNVGKSKSFVIRVAPPRPDDPNGKRDRDDVQQAKAENDKRDQEKRDQEGQSRDEKRKAGQSPEQKPTPEDARKGQLEKDLASTADKLPKDNPGDPKQGDPEPKDGKQEGKQGDGSQDAKQNPSPMNPGKDGKSDPSNAGKESGGEPMSPKDGKQGAGGKEGPKDGKENPGKGEPGKGPGEKEPAPPGKEAKNRTPGGGDDGSDGKKTGSTPDTRKNPDAEKGNADGKSPTGPQTKADPKSGPNGEKVESGSTSDKGKVDKGGTPPDGKAKPGDPKQLAGKEGTPGKSSGTPGAKDGKAEGDPKLAKSADGKGTEPTREEIDKLREQLKKGGERADDAADQLADRGKETKDPDLRKAIENALRDAGRQKELDRMQGKEETLPAPMQAGGPKTPEGKEPKEASGGPNGPKKDGPGGNDPGSATGPKGGAPDDRMPFTADDAFRRRLGSLQLDNVEDLKKRMSPDVLKKAGVSPEEWQQFLRNAVEYQKLVDRNRSRDDGKTLRGGASKIAGPAPRVAPSSPGAVLDPLAGATATAPLEFQEAQRAFTRKK